MDQKLTIQYKQLLLQFYNSVSTRHEDRSYKMGQLQEMMQRIQNLPYAPSSLKTYKNASQTTNCSLQQTTQTLFVQAKSAAQQNELFFTFRSNNIQRKSQTVNFKYTNPSIYKVLLYSILFNSLYLSSLSQHTTAQISDVYNHNKRNISWLQQIFNQILTKSYPSRLHYRYQQIIKLKNSLHNSTHCTEKVVREELANLINQIDQFLVQQIFGRLINPVKKQLPNIIQYSFRQSEIHGRQYNYTLINEIVDKISKQLGIRIKLQTQQQRMSWGNCKNLICFSIKKSVATGQYYLKEISYYSNKRTEYIQKKREKYKQMIVRKQSLEV